jgi:hypothetical protein
VAPTGATSGGHPLPFHVSVSPPLPASARLAGFPSFLVPPDRARHAPWFAASDHTVLVSAGADSTRYRRCARCKHEYVRASIHRHEEISIERRFWEICVKINYQIFL